MSRRTFQPRSEICQLCDFIIGRQLNVRQSFKSQRNLNSTQKYTGCRRLYSQTRGSVNGRQPRIIKSDPSALADGQQTITKHVAQAELMQEFEKAKAICTALLSSEKTPSEKEITLALANCNDVAKLLVYDPPTSSSSVGKKDGAATALLSLDESSSKKIPMHKLPPTIQHMVDDLSYLAYSVVKHPPVFIAPNILELYVSIQASLGKPQTFPEVFHLYSHKPVPQQDTSPTKYIKQNPNKVANAISASAADLALQTAINAKQLVIAMDIIHLSYTTKAFHRAKFVRKGLLPTTGLAVAPVAAYTVASQLASFQSTMDTEMATSVAFAGIMAYLGFTATVGVVAITTANDQMDRVTWAQGIPLRERWIREEERAAIDKVAGAWGFKETWRRGEEEGEDWEALREWVGHKGMILDRVELMEGME